MVLQLLSPMIDQTGEQRRVPTLWLLLLLLLLRLLLLLLLLLSVA